MSKVMDDLEVLLASYGDGRMAELATTGRLLALDAHLWADLGPKLTCDEAETFAEFLVAHGKREAAGWLLNSHAFEDEEGDLHDVDDDGNAITRPWEV